MARLQTFKQYARPWRTRVPWLAKHLTSIGWCQHDVIKKHQSCSIALAFQGELHFSGHCSLSSQISSDNSVIQIYTYYSHMKVEILLKLFKMYRNVQKSQDGTGGMTHIAVVIFKALGNGLKVIDRTGWGLRLLCLRSHFLLNHFPTEENWALFWHTTVFNFSYQKLLLPLQRLQRYFYRVNQRGWIACLVTGETVQIRCLIFVIPVHTGAWPVIFRVL